MSEQETQAIAIAKERKREKHVGEPRELTRVDLEEVSKDHLGAAGVVAVIIGLWGLAAFGAALVSSGGPLALFANWFQAVTGL
jgi:phenylpyruvate tautomerase PptA (4-oxalocrotonate tautomerase family)